MEKAENPHKGHRQKVRESYLANGLNGMADHNVLEFLLFFGIPQKDTNVLAHELLGRFGSFADVLRADVSELKAVKGMTENAACLLSMILPVYQRFCTSLAAERPVFETTADLVAFVRPYYLDATKERVFLLCLDDQNRLLSLRCLNEGSLSDVALDMRVFASTVLETKAKSVVLVHNHPNGIAQPSGNDIETTREVYAFLDQLKVRLLDHLILTETDYCALAQTRRYCHLFYGVDPLE
ncbi:MAG: RadC family protein [Clostridia bacterium]|nr:RadC family protein [Clostridia bacterium]